MAKMIRVVSKADGFRRAGRSWTGTTLVSPSDLTAGQLAALEAEPKLIVDEVEASGESKAAKGKGNDTDQPK